MMQREQLTRFLTDCIKKCPSEDGWVHLSRFGATIKRIEPQFSHQAHGATKLADLLVSFEDVFEIRADSNLYPPVIYARLRRQDSGSNFVAVPKNAVTATAPIQGSRRPEIPDIRDWAFFPNIPACLRALRQLALSEQWEFEDDDPDYGHSILWNYLRYTYVRLHREQKLMESEKIAAFNTGLVDHRYEPIFAVFTRNQNVGRQRWKWTDFCIAGEGRSGKDLVRAFNPLPQPAHYFSHLEEMIYDATCGAPEVDWEHVIIENIERLPLGFLKDHAPNGFEFRNPDEMSSEQRKVFFGALGDAVRQDSKIYRSIKNRLVDALDLAIKRIRWNFKTAIPVYYPRFNVMSLLLPLALMSEDKVDIALVVERTKSGSYLGHTIFTLRWAYMAARLVCRPDSDWLAPSSIATGQLSAATDERDGLG